VAPLCRAYRPLTRTLQRQVLVTASRPGFRALPGSPRLAVEARSKGRGAVALAGRAYRPLARKLQRPGPPFRVAPGFPRPAGVSEPRRPSPTGATPPEPAVVGGRGDDVVRRRPLPEVAPLDGGGHEVGEEVRRA